MHVPVQVDYGVRALVDLAQHSQGSTVRASEIARRQGIPEQYLARVLHSLQRHGLTKAQRGRRADTPWRGDHRISRWAPL